MQTTAGAWQYGDADRAALYDADFAFAEQSVVDLTDAFAGRLRANAMTVDVEEHFQVSAFEDHIRRDDWDAQTSRVERNIARLLELFSDAGARATFFTLGCVAEKHRSMIRSIVGAGHELASHGYSHRRVRNQTREEFADDVRRTKQLLEDISGQAVTGYRAPSFSIGDETPWAHEVLREAGHEYSSSVYPIEHDHYGSTALPRFPFRLQPSDMVEVPLTTVRVFNRNLPCAGGGYFRLMPLPYSLWSIRRVNEVDRMPAVFYMHPWEIDPDQPRVPGISAKTRFRHYLNLARFERRLARVLRSFKWDRMDAVYQDVLTDEKASHGRKR